MGNEVVSVKIDHEKCSLCGECTVEDGSFCPKNLYYKGKVKKGHEESEGIRFKFKDIANCQGCLICENKCPEGAIKPVKFEA